MNSGVVRHMLSVGAFVVPLAIAASAHALAAELEASVGATDFGAVEVGASSSATSFTLSYAGDNGLELTAPVLTGANPGDFSIEPGACVTGYMVQPAAPCTATVTFRPTSAGLKTAIVKTVGSIVISAGTGGNPCVQSDDGQGGARTTCENTFTVSGTGTTAAPSKAGAVPAAPSLAAALTPATKVIRAARAVVVVLTASNTGNVALSNVTTALPIPTGFAITRRAGGTLSGRSMSWTTATLAPGASANYAITLRPIGNAARRARLVTTASASGAPTATATATVVVVPVRAKKKVAPVTG